MSTYTREQVTAAINDAATDVSHWVSANGATVDLINLIVNVSIHYLDAGEDRTVPDAIEANYDATPDEVAEWVSD